MSRMGIMGRCPECGSVNRHVNNCHDFVWYVECEDCGYTGRERESSYDSIKSWNRAWYNPINMLKRKMI